MGTAGRNYCVSEFDFDRRIAALDRCLEDLIDQVAAGSSNGCALPLPRR
jgi:hypothetical protein